MGESPISGLTLLSPHVGDGFAQYPLGLTHAEYHSAASSLVGKYYTSISLCAVLHDCSTMWT